MARILCIDYGKRRCGIAVTDELRITASPLTTVNSSELLQFVLDYIANNRVDLVLIGKPITLRGEPSESWSYIEPFSRGLRKRLPISVDMQFYDERFTSTIAHRAMIDGGLRKKARRDKPTVDRVAATIILTDYLQSIYNK
ncbi:MAG: Holliday junction resolvase RuvX [Bacteroides sp.]|nr:Holliday junction resolvase RuvX [Bacteroides sp.]MCM1378658.1 Holliday junction resolvase RuvX [Bacteroides sp.]MCM1444931.1 Holliday junction resolvase RuvX [Prevotella sp.]